MAGVREIVKADDVVKIVKSADGRFICDRGITYSWDLVEMT
jgi:hypothetical protein